MTKLLSVVKCRSRLLFSRVIEGVEGRLILNDICLSHFKLDCIQTHQRQAPQLPLPLNKLCWHGWLTKLAQNFLSCRRNLTKINAKTDLHSSKVSLSCISVSGVWIIQIGNIIGLVIIYLTPFSHAVLKICASDKVICWYTAFITSDT